MNKLLIGILIIGLLCGCTSEPTPPKELPTKQTDSPRANSIEIQEKWNHEQETWAINKIKEYEGREIDTSKLPFNRTTANIKVVSTYLKLDLKNKLEITENTSQPGITDIIITAQAIDKMKPTIEELDNGTSIYKISKLIVQVSILMLLDDITIPNELWKKLTSDQTLNFAIKFLKTEKDFLKDETTPQKE